MQRMFRVALAAAILVGGTSLIAGAQDADSRVTEARGVFDEGMAHHDAGRFALAAGAFEHAFDLMRAAGHPNATLVLFNLARSLEQIPSRAADARAAYQRVIDETPTDGDHEDVIGRSILRIRELDARTASPAPAGGISPVGPIVLGSGAALLIVGLALALTGVAQSDDITSECPTRVGCSDSLRPTFDQARTFALVGDVMWIAGVAAAGTGLVLTLVLGNDDGFARAACGPGVCTFRMEF